MGSYVSGTIAALLMLVGIVLLLFLPGAAIVAGIALAIGIVLAVVLGISRAGARHAGMSDTEARHAEFDERHRSRRAR